MVYFLDSALTFSAFFLLRVLEAFHSFLQLSNSFLISTYSFLKGNVKLTIELGRFSDKKRIKVIRKFSKNDSNVRVNENDITVVSRIEEVELENDAIEAIDIWNVMSLYPDLKESVCGLLRPYVTKKI